MNVKAGRLIKGNIDFLAERWMTAIPDEKLSIDDFKRIGNDEVKNIIYQILEALAITLSESDKKYLFESKGIIYRKAKFLGELRRAQGFELDQVLQEYLVLRHEVWHMLREKLNHEDIDVFELEAQINHCLMNILKATIESFHHRHTRHLREQAITDALTGLYNRRQFDRIIVNEIYRADRYKRKLTLAMMDIDHFKMYNDLHGHPAGDYALEKVSDIIRQFLRVSDAAARYGGEEFALVLPETNQDQANRVCSRVRRAVDRFEFEIANKPTNLTISVGIACYPDDAQDARELVGFADKALYKAKRSGRNRVVCIAKDSDIRTKWFFNKVNNQKSETKS